MTISRIIIYLEIFYLTTASFLPTFPSWKMFSAIHIPQTFVMTNKQGGQVDLRQYLPRIYWSVDEVTLLDLAKFACIKENKDVVWSLKTKSGIYEFSENKCLFKKI